MADYQIETFYIGLIADLDPIEGNENVFSENAGDLVGAVFGSTDKPLYQMLSTVTLHDDNNNGTIAENDGESTTAEDITYEGTRSPLDSSHHYSVLITYVDGTTDTTRVVIAQDEQGRAFLLPNSEGALINRPLSAKAITSVEVVTASDTGYPRMNANLELNAFVCFAAGTNIKTDKGDQLIESLRPGDLVETLDSGLQKIVWIGSQAVTLGAKSAPVKFSAGVFGLNSPSSDLYVSQQHRMLIHVRNFGKNTDCVETFSAAKYLCRIDGISIFDDVAEIEYFHLLLENHEVVIANNAYCESFFLGTEALKILTESHKLELEKIDILGDGTPKESMALARPALKRREVDELLEKLSFKHPPSIFPSTFLNRANEGQDQSFAQSNAKAS